MQINITIPIRPFPVDPLKSFSKSFMDTSQFFISFNKYLDVLIQGQVAQGPDPGFQ